MEVKFPALFLCSSSSSKLFVALTSPGIELQECGRSGTVRGGGMGDSCWWGQGCYLTTTVLPGSCLKQTLISPGFGDHPVAED